MAERKDKGTGLLGGSKDRRRRLDVGGSARGGETRGGESSATGGRGVKRRKRQNRKIPGKSQRDEYTQSSTQIRNDRYLQILGMIKSDVEVQRFIREQCLEYDVEPGGGNPSYGYSELIEMLLVRWAEVELREAGL